MNPMPALLALQTDVLMAEIDPQNGPVSISTALLFLLVVSQAVMVAALVKLQARIDALLEQGAPPALISAAPAAGAPAAHASSATLAVTGEMLAVIAAAVHVTLAGRAQIVGITPIQSEERAWSLEGRRQIFQSHTLR
jgi:hypothetical protein